MAGESERAFVAGDLGRTVGPQRFGEGLLSVAKADQGVYSFAPLDIGNAEDGAFEAVCDIKAVSTSAE